MRQTVRITSSASRREINAAIAYLNAVFIGVLASGQHVGMVCVQGELPLDVTFYLTNEVTARRLAALVTDDLRHMISAEVTMTVGGAP